MLRRLKLLIEISLGCRQFEPRRTVATTQARAGCEATGCVLSCQGRKDLVHRPDSLCGNLKCHLEKFATGEELTKQHSGLAPPRLARFDLPIVV